MNGADLEICLMIHLICMFEFISSGSMFRFGLLNVIFYWCDLFLFLHCHMYFEKKTLVIFVSMLPWTVEYTALPSLALRSLFCWLDSPDQVPESGLSSDELYRCFSQDESSQKADVAMFFLIKTKELFASHDSHCFERLSVSNFQAFIPAHLPHRLRSGQMTSRDPNKNSFYHNIM